MKNCSLKVIVSDIVHQARLVPQRFQFRKVYSSGLCVFLITHEIATALLATCQMGHKIR